MHLNGEIGDPGQGLVGTQRGDHVGRRADMHVERLDEIGERVARHAVAAVDETFDRRAQADVGKTQGLGPGLSDENAAGADDTRRSVWRQRGQIGIDDRILQFGRAVACGASAERG